MRNQERIGGSQFSTTVEDSPPTTQQSEKQDFNFPSLIEHVEIPSKGRYYPVGHPLKDKETLELKCMSAKEEDILTNKSLLRKGMAIDKMLHSLLVDKTIVLDSLLIGDKNALVIEARISGYGKDYKTKLTCPSCGEVQSAEFDLEEAKKIHFVDDAEEGLVRFTENGTFVVELPRCKVLVECKFLTGKEEKELMFISEKKKKNNLPETMMTDQMKIFIVSVNGDFEKKTISQLVDNMPAIDSRWLRNVYKKVNPNVDLIAGFCCKSCGHEEEVNVPLGTNFFWPQ